VVAFAPGAVLAGDFIGRGRPTWNTQASAITVALNVVLCLLWIPSLGVLGAAWSSTVAYATGAAVMLWRFRRTTGLPWAEILVPRPGDLRR
jgi:Na+-driven multidrug efflux pump